MFPAQKFKAALNINLTIKKGNTLSFIIDGDTRQLILPPNHIHARQLRRSAKNRKARKVRVDALFPTDVFVKSVHINSDNAQVIIRGKHSIIELIDGILLPSESVISHYYERQRKNKILCAYFAQNETPPLNINTLVSKFDVCFAIDTNTKFVENVGNVSIATVINSEITKVTSTALASQPHINYSQIYIDAPNNPENYAWFRLIQNLKDHGLLNGNEKIGLIVDSDYDNLKYYNFRTKPYFDDHYLPKSFEFVYATDASGVIEFFPNQLINSCNSISNRVFSQNKIDSSMDNLVVKMEGNLGTLTT